MIKPGSRPSLRRREALLVLGGLAAAFWQAACGSGDSEETTTTGSGAATEAAPADGQGSAADCVLSPQSTEGPYYVPNELTRRDITEGRPGLPLVLEVRVVEAESCAPIESADVEVWHADAGGAYSGDGDLFLRGHQKSGADGRVVFETIYPGWYSGRTPHIHVKVHVGGSVVHTGQLFFDDRTSGSVYRTGAYRTRGEADTTNATDGIYAAAGAGRAELSLARRGGGRGLRGRTTVAVRA